MIYGVFIGLSALIGYLILKILNIKLPDGFERPILAKFSVIFLNFISFIAKNCHKYNLGKEPFVFKMFFKALNVASIVDDSDIIIKDTNISDVSVRIFSPKSDGKKLPAVIYYHGGGYVYGSVTNYSPLTLILAKKLNTIVISVDYRLAPESKYPIPVNDCWTTAEYILNNPDEFNIDIDRVAIAGDSAGGAAVAVITQRLAKENLKQPKLQVLIYPWLQHFDFTLPSYNYYKNNKLISFSGTSLVKLALWFVGEIDVTEEMEASVGASEHLVLIGDQKIKAAYADRLNADLIPEKYKINKPYYKNYTKLNKSEIFSKTLNDESIFKKNEKLSKLVNNLFNEDASPGLASDEILKKLPKAYVIVCEIDELKDENLIYAERLRLNGVDVKISFYENAFHGIIVAVSKIFSNKIAKQMLDDMIDYLKKNL